jgi:putative SOS response-associated peptidase YedK
MCGRFALAAEEPDLRALLEYEDDAEPFPPRYNIAPTQPIAVVREMHRRRRLGLVRWGLVPPFVEDPRRFGLLINARAEGITERGAFKNAIRYRRCLVPASGFYEWRKPPSGKGKRQPYWLKPKGGGLIAFAGIWETWHDRDGGEIDSAAIVTTSPNAVVAPIHDRMPVVIGPADFATWLTGDLDDALPLLAPAPDELLDAVQVGDRVNKADNDDPGLIAPVSPMKADLFG